MKEMPASQQLVISCITTSLLMLMEQKDYHKITIVDITKKAGVSRMAFYRNFDSKEDILFKYGDELFGTFINKLENNEYQDFKEFLRNLILVFQEHRSFFFQLIEANLLNLCWEHHMEQVQNRIREYLTTGNILPTDEYIFHFFTGGLMSVIRVYFYNNEPIPLDTLVELLDDMLFRIKPAHPLPF